MLGKQFAEFKLQTNSPLGKRPDIEKYFKHIGCMQYTIVNVTHIISHYHYQVSTYRTSRSTLSATYMCTM